ncbi:hypothetical protein PoB_000585800 [Plakobranchus ocellatus]|uniref:Uncharacterized protein n=1 Tax=Plakobranchus ocellatus TaxID=259542 RepID=A0AAV3YA15_9GAST|nr:hypothetical protein PoB_000585800 [Plakobranchus ocellatus]
MVARKLLWVFQFRSARVHQLEFLIQRGGRMECTIYIPTTAKLFETDASDPQAFAAESTATPTTAASPSATTIAAAAAAAAVAVAAVAVAATANTGKISNNSSRSRSSCNALLYIAPF